MMRGRAGEHICEQMDQAGMSRGGLAAKCGKPVDWVDGLIEGTMPITPEIAMELALSLDTGEAIWLDL